MQIKKIFKNKLLMMALMCIIFSLVLVQAENVLVREGEITTGNLSVTENLYAGGFINASDVRARNNLYGTNAYVSGAAIIGSSAGNSATLGGAAILNLYDAANSNQVTSLDGTHGIWISTPNNNVIPFYAADATHEVYLADGFYSGAAGRFYHTFGNYVHILEDSGDYLDVNNIFRLTPAGALIINTTTIASGTITDSTGKLSFGDENISMSKLTITSGATEGRAFELDAYTNDYDGSVAKETFLVRTDLAYTNKPIQNSYTGRFQMYGYLVNSSLTAGNMEMVALNNYLYKTSSAATINNSEASDRTLYGTSLHNTVYDTGTYESTGAGKIVSFNKGLYNYLNLAPKFRGGAADSRLDAMGTDLYISANPTLTSGTLTQSIMGEKISLACSATGSSYCYGIYGNSFTGADGNFFIFDNSGIQNSVVIDADNAMLRIGETQGRFDMYFDGTNPRFDSSSSTAKFTFNRNITAPGFEVLSPEYIEGVSLDTMVNPEEIKRAGKSEEEFHNTFDSKVVNTFEAVDESTCHQEIDEYCWEEIVKTESSYCVKYETYYINVTQFRRCVEYGIEAIESPQFICGNKISKDAKNVIEKYKTVCSTYNATSISVDKWLMMNYQLIYELREENEQLKQRIAALEAKAE